MAAGVELAKFYQIPGYRSWDPSVVLFFSFSVFFAMILSDAGYGLVLMIGLLVYWKRLGQSENGGGYRLLGSEPVRLFHRLRRPGGKLLRRDAA